MLVLVMTLLGILFVVGVAFLATMNFEADMISAERQRTQSESGVNAAATEAGAILRNMMMSAPGMPFGDTSVALSGSAFAEMPGVHNSFSPLEPIRKPGPDGTYFTPDDTFVFDGYFDAQAREAGSAGTVRIPSFSIDTVATNATQVISYNVSVPPPVGSPPGTMPTVVGVNLLRCADGPLKGNACSVPADCQTAPGPALYSCEGQGLADADGDGIVDSLLVDAREVGLSDAQLADLAARVNPASNLSGKVSIALRVVPHGGMVNLNDSHPMLIQTVFDIAPSIWPVPTDPNVDPSIGFRHGPTQDLVPYSPVHEEGLLRRRAIIPPRDFQASLLHGNPVPGVAGQPSGAHMPKQLFWWSKASGHEDVFAKGTANANGHRFWGFSPTELYPDDTNFYYWPVMMDPATANLASPPPGWPSPAGATGMSYDRRHLVTTISHDDLMARTAMVPTPRGKEDLRRAMIEALSPPPGLNDPNGCDPNVPFEYVFYPTSVANSVTCCKEDANCKPDSRGGRLQLSIPWIDDEMAAANDPAVSAAERLLYIARIQRTIHDVFFMLVRNAAAASEVEGMECEVDGDCPVVDTACLLAGAAVPAGQKGYCVHRANPGLVPFTDPNATNGPGCRSAVCGIPGAVCRSSDGVCTLAAPAWSDVECLSDADPRVMSSEFCLKAPGAVIGLCADRWTRMRRSEMLIARTAAALTANLIDFGDADHTPTRVAIRDFEFVTKCIGGTNHNLPCPTFDCTSGGGTCPARPLTAGREVDVDPVLNGACDDDTGCNPPLTVCSFNRVCIQPLNVYGLEQQPYITEVATYAKDAGSGPTVVARAIELFNPYGRGLTLNDADNAYYIVEVPPGTANPAGLTPITLSGDILANTGSATGPFAVFATGPTADKDVLLGTPVRGVPITGTGDLEFLKDWTIYLLRSTNPADPNAPKFVVDQFKVGASANHHVGEEGDGLKLPLCDPADPPTGDRCRFSVQRLVSAPAVASTPATAWTWPVPWFDELPDAGVTLGTWNGVTNPQIHPMEVEFANTGLYGSHFQATVPASFPTTGSLLLLMRHAHREIGDYTPKPVPTGTSGTVADLAFTTHLKGGVTRTVREENPPGSGTYQDVIIAFETEKQIDNGRIPLFDAGQFDAVTGIQSMHHLQPKLFKAWDPQGTDPNGTYKGMPGEMNTLPWGQLVFDYFTALPLSNGGPYHFDADGSPLSLIDLPKVDQGGMRAHGRININAAPWKVLSGLPLVPLDPPAGQPDRPSFAGLPQSIRNKLSPLISSGVVGPDLAQAIVAYRDARPISDATGTVLTGNYEDGTPATGTPSLTYGRGWTNPSPAARRGTGFMSVGELANVRHGGAVPGGLPPASPFRIDAGVIGSDPANKTNEDFVEAAAMLIALGDWVSVRSHVFTVYGMIRGADDPDVAALYTDPIQRAQALLEDTDARAIRFQETIDRLPVLQGQPRPQRIGERTVGKYTDVNND